ncbi:sulfite exporter TauE/SafE family protein [Hydrogenophaga sp.]|uniref:sulfite exporter TauE/SafE family protein n=1 Tax=Hydrogenophaga sp. TaxID=1904254 RepID=UPI0025C0AB10|nr:sulfite exporter TauE/SafE family protein [Hydrogenophaga sp.]
MLTTHSLMLLALIFLLGGLVKGTVGFGLPTIGIGLGALVVDIPTAMLLIALPTIATNVWQMWVNGDWRRIARRLWVFMLAAVWLIPLGVAAIVYVPAMPYQRLLGLIILIYSVWTLWGKDRVFPWAQNPTVAFVAGSLNAVLTGMTGCFSVPGVMYLRAVGLSKADLLGAMGMLYLLSAVGMLGSLWLMGKTTMALSQASLAACVPVALGLVLGTLIQKRLSEALFKRLFLASFAVLGLVLMATG